MKAPAATKASSQRSTTIAPAIPIATAAPIETTASAARARATGSAVASGRPFSSSSACAPIPTARKKAASAAPSRPGYHCGASAAPITT